MGWSDALDYIPGVAPIKWGYDALTDPNNAWLRGDPKVGMDPNDAKMGHGEYSSNYIQGMLGGVNGRSAPQMGAAALDPSRYNDWRSQQMGLANTLGQVASGQQKGAGEMAVNRQIQQALAAQQSAAQGARGANAMLGARAAARGAADVGVQGAGMASQSALQDQTNARQLQAQILGQGAGQDISIAGQNAGFQQQQSLSNMQAKLQQMGLNDQASLGYLAALTGIDEAELRARLQQEQLQVAQRDPGHLADILKMGGQAAATIAGA